MDIKKLKYYNFLYSLVGIFIAWITMPLVASLILDHKISYNLNFAFVIPANFWVIPLPSIYVPFFLIVISSIFVLLIKIHSKDGWKAKTYLLIANILLIIPYFVLASFLSYVLSGLR